jgi:hypothetical protein
VAGYVAATTATALRVAPPAAHTNAEDESAATKRALAPARVTLPLLPAGALIAPLLSCKCPRCGAAAAACRVAAPGRSLAVGRQRADRLVAGDRQTSIVESLLVQLPVAAVVGVLATVASDDVHDAGLSGFRRHGAVAAAADEGGRGDHRLRHVHVQVGGALLLLLS